MDLRAGQRLGVGQRAAEGGLEVGLAAGQAGEPALARGEVAGRRVEEHQIDAGRGQTRLQLLGRDLVGELAFDRAEPRPRRRLDPLGERPVAEHGADVGGKTRHGSPPRAFSPFYTMLRSAPSPSCTGRLTAESPAAQ